MKARAARELVRWHGDDWEPWAFSPVPGGLPRRMAAKENSSTKERILAVPARHVVALPLWVDSTDAQFVRESLDLELEVRGLLGRKKPEEVVSTRMLVVKDRTLVICAIFPTEAPEPPSGALFQSYDASPFLIAPEPNAVTLWREGPDLVALFTRERQPVYWATLDWPAGHGPIAGWLQLLITQLVSTGLLAAAPEKLVLDEGLRLENLGGLLPGAIEKFSALPPSLEGARFSWKPEGVRSREQKAAASEKMRGGLLALAGAYVLIAVLAVVYLVWLGLHAGQLRHDIAQLEAQTDAFQPTVREWQMVGPGAEADFFPLEILYRVVQHLPDKGVRLTIYEANAGRITIEGDAASAMLASQFYRALSEDRNLFALNWQMPTPALLPNNAAHFQLTGVTP